MSAVRAVIVRNYQDHSGDLSCWSRRLQFGFSWLDFEYVGELCMADTIS